MFFEKLQNNSGKFLVFAPFFTPATLLIVAAEPPIEPVKEQIKFPNPCTKIKRLKTKPIPDRDKTRMKLSEMWMNGLLGGVPDNF